MSDMPHLMRVLHTPALQMDTGTVVFACPLECNWTHQPRPDRGPLRVLFPDWPGNLTPEEISAALTNRSAEVAEMIGRIIYAAANPVTLPLRERAHRQARAQRDTERERTLKSLESGEVGAAELRAPRTMCAAARPKTKGGRGFRRVGRWPAKVHAAAPHH
ncbi:hypothetical protein [Nocardia sp. NPDC004711]